MASLFLLSFVASGCAGLFKPDSDGAKEGAPESTDQKLERLTKQQKVLQDQLAAAQTKLDGMEVRVGSLNDKLDATRSTFDNQDINRKAGSQAVNPRATDVGGTALTAGLAESDPEAGFVSDESVARYRKALILLESKNYSDAVLAFSSFIDQYPDHALAGSAQYYLAESYHHQGEFKLAAREYQRVLTTYDRSPHVADTLRRIAECEDKLQQPEAAAKHREMLATLFAASPAAAEMKAGKILVPEAAPVKHMEPNHAADENAHSTDAALHARDASPREAEPRAAEAKEAAPKDAGLRDSVKETAGHPTVDNGLDSPPPTAPAAPDQSQVPPPGVRE